MHTLPRGGSQLKNHKSGAQSQTQRSQLHTLGAPGAIATTETTFSSFLKAQNCEENHHSTGSKTNPTAPEALNIKYDIHALLVDAQNYYVKGRADGPGASAPHSQIVSRQVVVG